MLIFFHILRCGISALWDIRRKWTSCTLKKFLQDCIVPFCRRYLICIFMPTSFLVQIVSALSGGCRNGRVDEQTDMPKLKGFIVFGTLKIKSYYSAVLEE